MLESFVEKASGLLEDRAHSVLLAGVVLMLDICGMEPSAADVYRPHVPLLCRALRSLIMGGFAPGGWYDLRAAVWGGGRGGGWVAIGGVSGRPCEPSQLCC